MRRSKDKQKKITHQGPENGLPEYKEKKMNRRIFLKGAAASIAFASSASLLVAPQNALAAQAWPKETMDLTSIDEVLKALNVADASSSDMKIKAPQIAENGATVPIEVDATSLPGKVKKIAVLVEGNPRPLAGIFSYEEGANGMLGTRVKMGKSGKLTFVVMTDKGNFIDSRDVKVTIGGCGG